MVTRGRANQDLHERWRGVRAEGTGFADPKHPYRHQGSADLNLYKLFLERAHALLGPQGRLGFLVPSGLYSDHGTGALRSLFLERCRWEWLFGVENREGIFPIHRSYKFNPIIVQKRQDDRRDQHGVHAPQAGGLGARRGLGDTVFPQAGRAVQPEQPGHS